MITVKPARDMGILANPVILTDYERHITIIDSGFREIYDMERGGTEVGFEYDLEPIKLGIPTKQVEVKKFRAKIPGR